jgi:hypothetical protein
MSADALATTRDPDASVVMMAARMLRPGDVLAGGGTITSALATDPARTVVEVDWSYALEFGPWTLVALSAW